MATKTLTFHLITFWNIAKEKDGQSPAFLGMPTRLTELEFSHDDYLTVERRRLYWALASYEASLARRTATDVAPKYLLARCRELKMAVQTVIEYAGEDLHVPLSDRDAQLLINELMTARTKIITTREEGDVRDSHMLRLVAAIARGGEVRPGMDGDETAQWDVFARYLVQHREFESPSAPVWRYIDYPVSECNEET